MIRYASGSVLQEPDNALKGQTGGESSLSPASETFPSTKPPYSKQTLAKFLNVLGPTLVLVGFVAVFYFGHHNDWKIPKFGALTGTVKPVAKDWCEEHSVPESICVECDPSLMPKGPGFGWCPEHGIHNCPLHHPEVAQLKVVPNVQPSDLDRAARALSVVPRKENNSACEVYKTRIQFASVESVKQAGVDVELVERQPIAESIHTSGAIVYDPTRKASLASRVAGSVWTVEKNVGDSVAKGEVLAIVDSAEVGGLKTALMRSLAERKLQSQNVSRLTEAREAIVGSRILDAQAAYSKAQADVLSAEQSLRNLGLPVQVTALQSLSEQEVLDQLRLIGIPDSFRARLSGQLSSSNLMPIYSPLDGVVLERTVAPGEVVDSTRILFQIADVRQMWLTLNVPLENMNQLTIGQTVAFRADGSRETIRGKLDWISTSADKTTRMLQVRAVLNNSEGRLRNETFGTGEVILRSESDAIVIPTDSSHWEGCCQVVFVRDKSYFDSPDSYKVFHVRSVRLGAINGKYTEVIAGVLPGEVIATAGSDVLRAQLLKNNLGAGCDCCAK
jgi:cobalt-zinc-cadmium efflux system membrane fusion protein